MYQDEILHIGDIGNYYGGLSVKKENGEDEAAMYFEDIENSEPVRHFWSIENYTGHDWEEIPQYLYDALIKYENQRTSAQETTPCIKNLS